MRLAKETADGCRLRRESACGAAEAAAGIRGFPGSNHERDGEAGRAQAERYSASAEAGTSASAPPTSATASGRRRVSAG